MSSEHPNPEVSGKSTEFLSGFEPKTEPPSLMNVDAAPPWALGKQPSRMPWQRGKGNGFGGGSNPRGGNRFERNNFHSEDDNHWGSVGRGNRGGPMNDRGHSRRARGGRNKPMRGGGWAQQGQRQIVQYNDCDDMDYSSPDNGWSLNILETQPVPDFGAPNTSKLSDLSREWGVPSAVKKQRNSDSSEIDQTQSVDGPAPQRMKFSCNNCTKYFKTITDFSAHMQCHKKCTFPGCKFEATPSIIRRHEFAEHCGVNDQKMSAASANAYQNARKRNFPTDQRSERKEEEQNDRVERGEVSNCSQKKGKFSVDPGSSKGKDVKSHGNTSERVKRLLAEADSLKQLQFQGSTNTYSAGPQSLLHKLLQNEIRHEHNVLLQCIRYIRDNGYFDWRDPSQPWTTLSSKDASENTQSSAESFLQE